MGLSKFPLPTTTSGWAGSLRTDYSKQTYKRMINFFSSGLRQKVDQLMDILWDGGVNIPKDSIEQISCLLFLRLLTEKDETFASLDKKYARIVSGNWSRSAWGNLVTLAR